MPEDAENTDFFEKACRQHWEKPWSSKTRCDSQDGAQNSSQEKGRRDPCPFSFPSQKLAIKFQAEPNNLLGIKSNALDTMQALN